MGSIPVRVIKTPLRICARAFFVRPVRESNRAAARSAVSNQPSGLLLSPRVPRVRNVYRGCGCLSANAQGRFLLDPYGNRNNDDRCQRQKQGVIVGAVASKTRVPSKARSGCWEPQPGTGRLKQISFFSVFRSADRPEYPPASRPARPHRQR